MGQRIIQKLDFLAGLSKRVHQDSNAQGQVGAQNEEVTKVVTPSCPSSSIPRSPLSGRELASTLGISSKQVYHALQQGRQPSAPESGA